MPLECECLRAAEPHLALLYDLICSYLRCRSASLVEVQPNHRLTEHSSMRRAQQCLIRQAVCRQAIVTRAPRSRARLQHEPTRRRLMAKPCTPHLHCAARAALQAQSPQCRGSRGTPLAFLWGFKRGYSLRKENTPFIARFRTVRKTPARDAGFVFA